MRGSTHLAVGVLAGALLTGSPAGVMLGAFGGLLPDIDHPSSKLGRRLSPLSWMTNLTFGHRTITHSLLFLCLLFGLAYFYPVLLPMAVGAMLHIICDALTVQGVPLLYPFKRRFRLLYQLMPLSELVVYVGSLLAIVWLSYQFIADKF